MLSHKVRGLQSLACSRSAHMFLIGMVLAFLILTYVFDFWSIQVQFHPTGRKSEQYTGGYDGGQGVPAVDSSGQVPRVEVKNKLVPNTSTSIPTTTKLATTTTTTIAVTTSLPKITTKLATTTHKVLTPTPTLPVVTENNIPDVHVPTISCAKLIQGDRSEKMRADRHQKLHPKAPVPAQSFVTQASNCEAFRRDRRYLTVPVNKEELEFPLAFSLLIFKDIEQFERLLRAIYRPQNYYCVHVDSKSKPVVKEAAEAIAKCFDNVFIASKASDVQWGTWTVLEPELTCMKDLLKYKSWRYFINLTGQEFPLKTNLDLVRILHIYNGANNMEGTVKRRNLDRTAHKGPLPADITLTKGSVHVTASRPFVDYVINNKTAQKFAEWLKDTGVPDESFFSSLNHSPQLGIPGAFTGDPETNTEHYLFITRFKNWGTWPFSYPCAGQRVRMVCVFAVGDLPLLASRPELFANKFYLDWEWLTLDCMEELHYNRTRAQVMGKGSPHLDLDFYRQLDFVKDHVPVDQKR